MGGGGSAPTKSTPADTQVPIGSSWPGNPATTQVPSTYGGMLPLLASQLAGGGYGDQGGILSQLSQLYSPMTLPAPGQYGSGSPLIPPFHMAGQQTGQANAPVKKRWQGAPTR